MVVPDNRKLDVLIAQLQERYAALHRMRDRSTQFALWILGFGLGMGWLLIHEITISSSQRKLIGLFVIAVGLLSINFVCAIGRGFRTHRRIIIEIERTLGLFDKEVYHSDGAVLPMEFSDLSTKWSGHFRTLIILMAGVFLFLLLLTFLYPVEDKKDFRQQPLRKNSKISEKRDKNG